jgi:hypothetical protein
MLEFILMFSLLMNIFSGGLSMMFSINDISILKGDNYHKWYRKLDLYFIMGELNSSPSYTNSHRACDFCEGGHRHRCFLEANRAFL